MFINCKVRNADGTVLGVVGVGVRVDWFEIYEQQELREQALSWKEDETTLELWDASGPGYLSDGCGKTV